MGAYKCDVVVVIKMGGYIHGVLILCGCLLSRFYSITKAGVAIVKVQTGCGGILLMSTSVRNIMETPLYTRCVNELVID